MNAERAIFEQADSEAEAAADARPRANIAAGRMVSHADGSTWLATWGTDAETPVPAEWFR